MDVGAAGKEVGVRRYEVLFLCSGTLASTREEAGPALTPSDLIQHLLELRLDYLGVCVFSASVQAHESIASLVVASLFRQPTRRVWQKKHAEQQHDGWNNLDSKRDAPLARVGQELAAIADPTRANQ